MSKLGQRILESRNIKVNEDTDPRYEEYLKKMRDNDTYKKMDALCSQYGYKLYSASAVTRKNGSKRIELNIREDKKTYHAEIYYDVKWGSDEGTWEIQTTAYGSMDMEEYAKFLKGCQDSYNLVSELKKIDLNTLYDPSVDYPEE